MLTLYDINHNKISVLESAKETHVEKDLSGEEILFFSYPQNEDKYNLIKEECYVRTKANEYVIKEINVGENWTEIVCKLNVEELKGNVFPHFETLEQPCINALRLALSGSSWRIGTCDVDKARTIKKKNTNSYNLLQEIRNVYYCEFKFDSINKVVYVYKQIGMDKGAYFIDALNLKKLDIQRNSYDYITRLIPIGKDDLDIKTINNGLNYLENYQYSSKIITAYWEDTRYTNAQELKEDATIKLNELSKPKIAYKAEVLDLANISENKYSILDYALGDIITLKDASKEIKDKQRIVKLIEYLEEPERNQVEIANTLLTFDDMHLRVEAAADTVENVTNSEGQLIGNKIDSIDYSKIKNISVKNADIQDGAVVTAKIGELQVTTAKLADAAVTSAKIGKAEIDTANIKNAAITAVKIQEGCITTALIENGAVGTAQISDGSITDAKIVNMTANKITAGKIDAAEIEVINLNASNITVGTINGQQISEGAIDTSKISDRSITNEKIALKAVVSENISADAVTSDKIVAGAITADKIAVNAVTSNAIAANSITTAKLSAGAVTTNEIAAGTITANKLSSEVGSNIDISSNNTIIQTAKEIKMAISNDIIKVRYIRDWCQGSNVDDQNIWLEVKAVDSTGNNVLKNFVATSNNTLYNAQYITDENLTNKSNYGYGVDKTNQYIQFDLGSIREDIEFIKIWHYYFDNRSFHGTKTEVSDDGVNWTALFDSNIGGEYKESINGHTLVVNGQGKSYTNMVKINDNGLEVSHASVGTKSTMTAEGFRIIDNSTNESVAEFAGSKRGFSYISVGDISCPALIKKNNAGNSINSIVKYYVKSAEGSDSNDGLSENKAFATIQKAVDSVEKIINNSQSVYIYVKAGTYNENIKILDFSGSGTLYIVCDSAGVIINGSIAVIGCTTIINLNGGRTGFNTTNGVRLNISQANFSGIYVGRCMHVVVEGFVIKGLNNSDGIGINYDYHSGGSIFHCDISTFSKAIHVGTVCRVWCYDNCGSGNTYGTFITYGGYTAHPNGTIIPKGIYNITAVNAGQNYFDGTNTPQDSYCNPPPIPPQATAQWICSLSSSYRDNYGTWRTDNNYVYQGKWDIYGSYTGAVWFDNNSIRNTLNGKSIKSSRLYLSRYNGGGNSGATDTYLVGITNSSNTGAPNRNRSYGYIGSYSWGDGHFVSIPAAAVSDLVLGTINALALYNGASGYEFFYGANSAILEVTYA